MMWLKTFHVHMHDQDTVCTYTPPSWLSRHASSKQAQWHPTLHSLLRHGCLQHTACRLCPSQPYHDSHRTTEAQSSVTPLCTSYRASKTILSADDIVRARERQRRLAVLGGKRPDGDALQLQTHAAKRARWEAAAMAGVAPQAPETVLTRLDAMVPTCAWTVPVETQLAVGMANNPATPEAIMQAARDGQSAAAVDYGEAIGAWVCA